MIFAEPIPFSEAVENRAAKRLLLTDLDTAQLDDLPVELREMASFSAGVIKAETLQRFDDLTKKIAGGATPEDFARRAAAEERINTAVAAGATPSQARQAEGGGPLLTSMATARQEIRTYLRSIGYKAKPGEEGTIKDLSTDRRINVKLRTDVEMMHGYGQYTAGQSPITLDLTPCQELVRVSRRRVPRNWAARWKAAGGKFYGHGRMIAAKDDPIWKKISRFGLPYPPFDYNSGMGLRNIRRAEAMALGVIPENYKVKPDPARKLTDNLQASAARFDAAMVHALDQTGYKVRDGVLTANERRLYL